MGRGRVGVGGMVDGMVGWEVHEADVETCL